jgi:hypothetical protein
MHSDIEYRGYTIFCDGSDFVAEPIVPDDVVFEIGAGSVQELMNMIDELWTATAYIHAGMTHTRSPRWYQDWLSRGMMGRIRKPETTITGSHKPTRPKVKRRLCMTILSTSLAAFGFSHFMATLDIDDDGYVAFQDVASWARANFWVGRSEPIRMRRTVEFAGKRYEILYERSEDEPHVLKAMDVKLATLTPIRSASNVPGMP